MAITKTSPRDEKGRIIKKPKPSAVTPAATVQAAVGLMNESNSVTTPPAVPDAADTTRRITALIPSGLYKKLAHYAVDNSQTVTDALVNILREKLG